MTSVCVNRIGAAAAVQPRTDTEHLLDRRHVSIVNHELSDADLGLGFEVAVDAVLSELVEEDLS